MVHSLGVPIKSLLLVCAVLIAGFATLSATPASAASVQVSGLQTPAGPGLCVDPGALASYTMQGSLLGCWYVDTFTPKSQPTSGTFQATGTERFAGCLDLDGDQACSGGDPQGTLSFSFQFTGKADPVTGAAIHGRCQHPIIAGTGDFAGASGVITFKDDVTNGTSLYRGPIAPVRKGGI
jgi:hypothetical protein